MDLDTIWTQYHDRLASFLRKKVANSADVDDLLQDISIRVINGLPGLRDKAKLQPWLFQTANNAIIDHYRSRARRAAPDPDDLWYTQEDPDVRRDLEQCVEPFIRALPSDMANLLTAIDLNGQSQKAYADTLGLPYSTLKSQVHKARSELRVLFEDCCAFQRDSRGHVINYNVKSDTCKNC
ncbi:MAG: RNA polymerase sigma factor SigZ [Paracoccaceae bacterium]